MFISLGIIAMLSVVAAVGYYAMFSVTLNVNSAITTDGDLEQALGEVYSGEVVRGSEIEISNQAPSSRVITLSDDSDEDVSVVYKGILNLAQKNVDFNADVWTLVEGGETAIVEYSLNGDKFTAEVVEGAKEGYVLVYYKDNSDRFNSPAKAIGVSGVSGNLPYEDDANVENDYCASGEYSTCAGAKIWYISETAVDSEGNIDWTQASSFLFETELIQYNTESEFTIYAESSLDVTPVYTVSDYAEGEYTVTTTVA